MISATYGNLSGGYSAARTDRPATQNYTPFPTSADTAMFYQQRTIRGRVRDMARNAPLAAGAINTTVTSVVGSGLQFHSRIDREALGMSKDEAEAWQRNTEREFRLWAMRECDLTESQNFYEMQDLVFRSTLESGDVFVLTPMKARKGAVYSTRLQVIEADQVVNKDFGPNTATLFDGVEFDKDNRNPIKYWVMNRHPGDFMRTDPWEWRGVPARGGKTNRRNVIHLFRRLRPGQTRGVSILAPVLETLKQLDRYTEAEITAAVVSGMYALFVETPGAEGVAPLPTDPNNPALPGQADLQLRPGLIGELAPGETIKAHNPGRPNTAFDPFVQAILRQVGTALELPFEILVKHFTASYSASRGALIEAWRMFSSRREWLANSFCVPVLECWMDEAVAMGRIDAPGYFDDPAIRFAYLGSDWTGSGMGSLNPLQEANARKTLIESNLTTHAKQIVEVDGDDWMAVFEQRDSEHQYLTSKGLIPQASQAGPGAPPPPVNAFPDAPGKQEDE